jgi:hypothetical protein
VPVVATHLLQSGVWCGRTAVSIPVGAALVSPLHLDRHRLSLGWMASLLLTQDWLLDCAVSVMSVDVQLALSSVYMHVLCLNKQR